MNPIRIALCFVLAACAAWAGTPPRDLLPDGFSYDPSVPSPQSFLGYEIGEFHTRHDRLVAYFSRLAETSDRAKFEITGTTNEMRSLLLVTISSPRNLRRLEEIRRQHLEALDPAARNPDPDRPVILYLGYGVHGNESSASEAAMVTAYHFAAGKDPAIERILDRAVILVDPVYNPDGRDRASHWFNMHKGRHPSADPAEREHNEGWPNGRTNHYWFDLNRDWLPVVHGETRVRVDNFHRWKPNVTTDYHEMGSNATYFFEPTDVLSRNPHVPTSHYEMTARFAQAWAKALDQIGSLYYTKERFDDFYPGYGSSYPDLNGGLGFLFEQASARGHVQESIHGELSFAFAIRNQVRTGVATVETAVRLRSELLDLQREFYRTAMDDPGATKAFVFGDDLDRGRNREFLELLKRHRVEVRRLGREVTIDDQRFSPENSWIVPVRQPQKRMVLSIFETRTEFTNTSFYDASTWSMAYSYGLPHAALGASAFNDALLGPEVDALPDFPGQAGPLSEYAYAFELLDSRAHPMLYSLLNDEVLIKVSFKPFRAATARGEREFSRGTMVIPVAAQKKSGQELHDRLRAAAARHGVDVYSFASGLSAEGIDLGSPNLRLVEKPKVLLAIGQGISAYEAGELWHLFDTHVAMPISKVDLRRLGRTDLDRYNTIVMVSGNYSSLNARTKTRLTGWIERGGTLIATKSAGSWLIREKIIAETVRSAPEESKEDEEKPRFDFDQAQRIEGAKAIGGAIFRTDLDVTHPLAFGYARRDLAVYRNSSLMIEPSANPYSTVARYADEPLISGYISQENLERLGGSASILVSSKGGGRVIFFVDNPNFRGFWHGTNRLFLNAVFMGSVIQSPRVRR